jgi:hypothetical protein
MPSLQSAFDASEQTLLFVPFTSPALNPAALICRLQFVADHIALTRALNDKQPRSHRDESSSKRLRASKHAPHHKEGSAQHQNHKLVISNINSTLYGHMQLLFDVVMAEMDAGVYVPVVGQATARCAATLPWWALSAGESGADEQGGQGEGGEQGGQQQEQELEGPGGADSDALKQRFKYWMQHTGNEGAHLQPLAGFRVSSRH